MSTNVKTEIVSFGLQLFISVLKGIWVNGAWKLSSAMTCKNSTCVIVDQIVFHIKRGQVIMLCVFVFALVQRS